MSPAKQLLPVISYAIEPKTKADEDKIHNALHRLIEEETNLESLRGSPDQGVYLSRGLGQVHLDVIVEKTEAQVQRGCGTESPKVPYLKPSSGLPRCRGSTRSNRAVAGQYGECWIEMGPTGRGDG